MSTKFNGVKYAAYFSANSGMSIAAQNYVMAFHQAGATVITEIVPNIETTKHLGDAYEFAQSRVGAQDKYDTKIIHVTPELVRKHVEPMKKNIFHLFWETDKIPEWWAWELEHSVDEIWTGCEWNKQTFFNSGITKPIWVCPQPVPSFPTDVKPFHFDGQPEFLFGSVFQWIERKAPEKLIKSFCNAFRDNKHVGLLIKSYKERFTQVETNEILAQINQWKKECGCEYPKIFLYPEALEKNDMNRFYKTIQCFVSPHRGEGWGIGIAEAMSAGIPVISTNLGGIHEHVPKEFWYPVDYTWRPVFNMDWIPWYSPDQNWAEPDELMIQEQMKRVYDFYGEAAQRGAKSKAYVEEHMNYKTIGQKMLAHLGKI